MTRLMEQAIARLRAVPEKQQEGLAQFLLNELEEDERWIRSTADHETRLNAFVGKILADDEAGNSEPLDAERL
jgi:hypothetical protein